MKGFTVYLKLGEEERAIALGEVMNLPAGAIRDHPDLRVAGITLFGERRFGTGRRP